MPLDPPGFLIEVPYGKPRETAHSPKYHWRCWDRDHVGFVILQYTLTGEGRFRTPDREWRVPAGHAFIALVPEQAEYCHPGGGAMPWTFCWLNFYGKLARDLWGEIRAAHGPVFPLPLRSSAAQRLRKLAAEGARRTGVDRFERAAEAYALWTECGRQLGGDPGPDPLGDPEGFAARHYRDPWAVKEMAALAGMSREHFTRRFRERHGLGPAAWLRRMRVGTARRLLRESGLPLAEVALRCGFATPRQLTRALRPPAFHKKSTAR